ncbi:MAG: glycosyltransferase family 4 protein [Thermomicrobiaceae bacterium]
MDRGTYIHLIHRYYPFRGGSEYYFQALSERLARDGADVRLVTTDAWDLEYFWNPKKRRVEIPFERHNGVKIYRTPAHHLPFANLSHRVIRRGMGEFSRVALPGQTAVLGKLSRFGPWLPELPELLTRIAADADIIHPANIALETLIRESAKFARQREIPLVITPKLHLGERESSAVRRYYTMPHQLELLRQADMVMTQTSIEADFLVSKGVHEERVRVVGLGIDVEEVTGGDGDRIRQALGIEGSLVLALGAAAYDKGTVHACKAVLKLNQQAGVDPVTLVVAGPIMSDFQRYIDTLTADQREYIMVLGYVDEVTRTDLLAACDVLTLASRTEAFGYVFLEAWANEKPVIGANAGGIPAVVDHGDDGLLVPFGDVDQLAESMRMILGDSELAMKLGRTGKAKKVVDTDTWYRKVREGYDELLGVPSTVSGGDRGPA